MYFHTALLTEIELINDTSVNIFQKSESHSEKLLRRNLHRCDDKAKTNVERSTEVND